MTALTFRYPRFVGPFGAFRPADALVRSSAGSRPAESAWFVPAADVVRDGDDAVVRVELPGVDVASDVTVEVVDHRLSIAGERRDLLALLVGEVGDHDVRALRGEGTRIGLADPTGGAGDDDGLVLETLRTHCPAFCVDDVLALRGSLHSYLREHEQNALERCLPVTCRGSASSVEVAPLCRAGSVAGLAWTTKEHS